jgi:hypothetical protein
MWPPLYGLRSAKYPHAVLTRLMTLIVSVVGPGLVFQVSDRRVTVVAPDGTRSVREEPAIKSVVFCNRAIFGFSGYAELERTRTDLWIADRLVEANSVADGLDRIRARLDRVWTGPRYEFGSSVVGVGYLLDNSAAKDPFIALVSNQFADGEWLETRQPTFSTTLMRFANEIAVFAAPGWLQEDAITDLKQQLGTARDLESAVSAVVASIREVAREHLEVGADLILSILPQSSAGDRESVLRGSLDGRLSVESPTFHYLPEHASSVVFGPTFVCGGSVSTDFSVRSEISEEESARWEADRKEFLRANRPQHAYVVAVSSSPDGSTNGQMRQPVVPPDAIPGSTNYYHPSADLCLVLTPHVIDREFEIEITTIEQLEALLAEWGGGFVVETVSEVTGIGWHD